MPARLVLPAPVKASEQETSAATMPPSASSSSTSLALAKDLEFITRGRSNVQATFSAVVPAGPQAIQARPDAAAEDATRQRTGKLLAAIATAKVNAASVSVLPQQQQASSRYIKLNGATDPVTGKTTMERVIHTVEARKDPLEPAQFKFRAAPKGPGSPPVPKLSSPPKKATAEQMAAWVIPPSVSNWKNPKGYTISLDKRMAAAGEAEAPEVGPGFAKLAEALMGAEDSSRAQVTLRAKLRAEQSDKAKELENENLRIKAAEARAARAAAVSSTSAPVSAPSGGGGHGGGDDNTPPARRARDDDDEARRKRDQQRRELEKEVERDVRLEAAGKRTRMSREQDRDVSERVALGLPVPKASAESQFDARLFNSGGAGVGAGHGFDDDEDNHYTTRLFKSGGEHIYKPSAEVRAGDQSKAAAAKLEELKSTERFQPAFKGGESAAASAPLQQRSGPVQFERAASVDPVTGIALSAVQRKAASVLEGLGTRAPTTMSARASGGVEGRLVGGRFEGDEDDPTGEYAQQPAASSAKAAGKRPAMQFVKSSE